MQKCGPCADVACCRLGCVAVKVPEPSDINRLAQAWGMERHRLCTSWAMVQLKRSRAQARQADASRAQVSLCAQGRRCSGVRGASWLRWRENNVLANFLLHS